MKKTVREKFAEIDIPLQECFIRQFIASFAILVVGIVFFIWMKFNWKVIVTAFILALIFAGRTIYQVLKCFDGDVLVYEGTCLETYSKTGKRKYITIDVNNFFIKFYYSKNIGFEEGNTVVIYCPTNAICQKGEDNGIINSCYYVYIKRKNKVTKKEAKVTKHNKLLHLTR